MKEEMDLETKGRQVGGLSNKPHVHKHTQVSPFKSQGKAKRRWQKGMRRGKKEEEKTTATELCRGFNQPNYSLITETWNLEQLTHTHTRHTSTHTHVQPLTAHSTDNISQMRWKLPCQTDYFNSEKKLNLKEELQQ